MTRLPRVDPERAPRLRREALADALAVFERLHGHERQRRYETEGLLEAVRILMGAQSCTAAFRELVAVLARLIPFEDAFLLQGAASDRWVPVEATDSLYMGLAWESGPMLGRIAQGKVLALFDAHRVPAWAAQPAPVLERVRSALHLPLNGSSKCAALVFIHSRQAAFDSKHVELLKRLAPLSNQALLNMEYRDGLEHGARELRRVNRILNALTRCNEALMRARDEQELLDTICAHVVELGGYRLAWVGYPCDDEYKTVRPVAHVGTDRDYVDQLCLSWGEDEHRRGVGGAAIRHGRAVVARDTGTDPAFERWRSEVRRRALASCIALPITSKNGTVGTLSIYSTEVDAFDSAQIRMLGDLAANLGYGIANLRESRAREQAERERDFSANYDALTGLPNRTLLRDRLNQAMDHARRVDSGIAVVLFNLDRFKVVNDSQGPDIGDAVLVAVGKRILERVCADDTVARGSGDEFIVILGEIESADAATGIVQELLVAMAEAVVIEDHIIPVGASAGVSFFPQDGESAEHLLRNAGAALHEAKAMGGNALRLYSPRMNEHAARRFAMEGALRLALQRNELVLHFQPKVSFETGRIVGMEALVRWEQPGHGMRSPAEFIPVAEETGLIVPLGQWVLRSACAKLREWEEAGLPVVPVSVNLSPRQFHHANLVEEVETVLLETGLEARLLELEITETTLMNDVNATIATLKALKALGVRLSLDDFGTGYSSLDYLKRFPIDTLKIDQVFVRDITTNTQDAAICVAIIGLAHTLRMSVVAEGVETHAQMRFLHTHGCDVLQGYLFSAPVADEAFAKLLINGETLPALGARACAAGHHGNPVEPG